MSSVIKEGLEQALKICAAEPIHQIGTIQPHGAALVLSANSLRTVLQAIANIDQFINLPTEGRLASRWLNSWGTLRRFRLKSCCKTLKYTKRLPV